MLSKDLASPCPFSLRKYARVRKKKETRIAHEGDVLRQVANTKGTGHSPTRLAILFLSAGISKARIQHLERVASFTGAPDAAH